MIQASCEVLLELLLDVVDLLVFLVLLVLEPIVQELSQSNQLLLLDGTALAQVLLVDRLPELAVPVEPVRIEAMRRKLETCLLGLRHRVELDKDLAHDSVTALDVVDLSLAHEEVVLRLVDVLLVLVSESEFEVLRSNRQREVTIVDVLVVHLVDHFGGAGRDRKVVIDFEVAGVWYLLKCLVLMVIPWLQEVALRASALVSRLEQLHHFFPDLRLDFCVELFIIELEEIG